MLNSDLYMKKLFSELEFLKVDLDYKNQMMDKYKTDFNEHVLKFLEQHQDIKKEYDEILNYPPENIEKFEPTEDQKIEQENRQKEIEEAAQESEFAENLEKRTFTEDFDIKRIYREVVKMTHPDKLKNKDENEQIVLKKLYLEATDAYHKQNLYEIVRIAILLRIDIGDLSDENIDRLIEELKKFKIDIKVIESSMVWKYFEELADEGQRQFMIKQFILQFIYANRKN